MEDSSRNSFPVSGGSGSSDISTLPKPESYEKKPSVTTDTSTLGRKNNGRNKNSGKSNKKSGSGDKNSQGSSTRSSDKFVKSVSKKKSKKTKKIKKPGKGGKALLPTFEVIGNTSNGMCNWSLCMCVF